MFNMEDAYKKIASGILAFVADDKWDNAGTRYVVLDKYTKTAYWRELNGILIENDRFPETALECEISDALLLLRSEMLKTGDLIFGINFTLYPSGKFEIEYDYNQPEGYEETDETISIEDAMRRLNNLLG